MQAYQFDQLKDVTRKLFLEDCFDGFCVTEASFQTLVLYEIDGKKNPEFSEGSGESSAQEYVMWSEIRNICFQMIKGKKTPTAFKVTFYLPTAAAALKLADPVLDTPSVAGYFLNLVFKAGKLTAVTGTNMKSFTMDKEPERHFDTDILEWLKENGLTVAPVVGQ